MTQAEEGKSALKGARSACAFISVLPLEGFDVFIFLSLSL